MEHFNGLHPGEHERLSHLMEEMGESIQIIGKIFRHGFSSTHPDNPTVTNRSELAKEIGHVQYSIQKLLNWEDISELLLKKSIKEKSSNIGLYLHHADEQ